MHTAAEMIQFCEQHNPIPGRLFPGDEAHFLLLETALYPAENVRFCFLGYDNSAHPELHDGGCAYAITESRLLFAQKNFFHEPVFSIPLADIRAVAATRNALYGILCLQIQGGMMYINVAAKQAPAIRDVLNAACRPKSI